MTFDEAPAPPARTALKNEYTLRYMLRWETRRSATFLDIDKLQTPFAYTLRLTGDGVTKPKPVDLPETFVYLPGLDVESRRVYYDGERHYVVYRCRQRDGHCVVVLWRDTTGLAQSHYERECAFVAERGLIEGADEVFVNGSC
ncbi:MAG: hypothetical protein NZM04_09250 [Methylacidiphilales bacterium]|nr:hypothetical protein [Candidatus Methylacidiphilales bacterium]